MKLEKVEKRKSGKDDSVIDKDQEKEIDKSDEDESEFEEEVWQVNAFLVDLETTY